MKKALLGAILLVLASAVPVPAMAGVDISIGVSLPPPIVFVGPPDVIVMPDTDSVYVVPDIEVDLFFWNGWWWRPWQGGWYRSQYHNHGWAYYNDVPGFYFDVDPGWRGHYRDHSWYGRRWDYERVPHRRLQQNWKGWRDTRYWERKRTWGVQSYQPRPERQKYELRRQRQEHYQQRSDVQRHQQWKREQQQPKGKQVRRPQGQPAERERITNPQGGHGGRDERQVRPPKKKGFDDGPEQKREKW
jgi:hypothetical protein